MGIESIEETLDRVTDSLTERIMKLQGIVLRNGKRSGLLLARKAFLDSGDAAAVATINRLLEGLGPFESPDW